MREEPTWRIPVGIIGLLIALLFYAMAIAIILPPVIAQWSGLARTLIYIILGLIWLLPLRRFLIWMETGKWSPPPSTKEP